MFRMWGKIFHNNKLIKDTTIIIEEEKSRTKKVFQSLEEICYEFDLEQPIWLENNISEFKRHSKVRFYQDSFIETLAFDYLELQVIEED